MRKEEKQALIRDVFENARALVWAESLQNQCQELGVGAEVLQGFRGAFDRHLEKEWPQWRAEAQGLSVERLLDLRAEYLERAEEVGMRQWKNERSQDRFGNRLDEYAQ